jgi:hypothetical protein
MKRYPIDNFYVGNLNLAFPKGNMLLFSVGAYKMNNDEKKMKDLLFRTIENGAINLVDLHMMSVINKNNSLLYIPLLSLFYKVDDNKYLCLHNGNTYEVNSNESFCSDLYKISDVLPKFGYNLPKELSSLKASYLFKCLFDKKKRFPYNNDKFNLNDFYLGGLDLCCGYNDKNGIISHVELNVPTQIIMFNQGIYKASGYGRKTISDNNEFVADYCVFDSIYLKLDDENYYNINNFKIYNIDKYEPFSDKVTLTSLLKFDNYYGELPIEVSIPKILKKQKSIK